VTGFGKEKSEPFFVGENKKAGHVARLKKTLPIELSALGQAAG